MFTSCAVTFADKRAGIEHDAATDGGSIQFNYAPANFQGTPVARLVIFGAAGTSLAPVKHALGLSNAHIIDLTEQSLTVTGFVSPDANPVHSLPEDAHAVGVRVSVTLTLPSTASAKPDAA